MPGKLRCWYHGGTAGRPPGIPMHPNTQKARKAGYDRWLQMMRLAKQQGLIEKFPTGQRRRDAPKLSADKTVRRAQRLMEQVMAKRSGSANGVGTQALTTPRPIAAPSWEQMGKADKLSHAADISLDVARQILELGVDPTNPRVLGHVKETALAIIGLQVKVDEGGFEASRKSLERELILQRMVRELPDGKGPK